MVRDQETREEYDRRMEREFLGRFFLTFGVPSLLLLLAAFIATRR